MKNSIRRGLFAAALITPFVVIVLSSVIWADQGIIITLENTGPSPITEAILGFNLQPRNAGQATEVTVGVGSNPYNSNNIGDFQIGVMPISGDNPLAPGETACVGPLYHLVPDDYVKFVEVSSFGNGVSTAPPHGGFKIKPDVSTFPFDYVHDAVQGGRLTGVFRFLTSVPAGCKTDYVPPFGIIKIDASAAFTASASVGLSLRCYPTVGYSCKEMQFSNDNINWSVPEPYTRDKRWILSAGDGEKTVYIKFMDNIGNWSNVYSAKISLSAATLAPNGSEIIPSGSTYNIQWAAPFSAETFDLKYSLNNGSTWKTIASKITGTNYDWHVPALLNNKAYCLVKVISFDFAGKKIGEEVSDSAFTIELVQITSPDEGEVLKSGDTWTITWRTNETVRPVAGVKLFYSINGGASWKAIKTVKNNPGSYDWIVPDVSSSSCKVKVVLKDAGGAAVGNNASEGFFTIQQ